MALSASERVPLSTGIAAASNKNGCGCGFRVASSAWPPRPPARPPARRSRRSSPAAKTRRLHARPLAGRAAARPPRKKRRSLARCPSPPTGRNACYLKLLSGFASERFEIKNAPQTLGEFGDAGCNGRAQSHGRLPCRSACHGRPSSLKPAKPRLRRVASGGIERRRRSAGGRALINGVAWHGGPGRQHSAVQPGRQLKRCCAASAQQAWKHWTNAGLNRHVSAGFVRTLRYLYQKPL